MRCARRASALVALALLYPVRWWISRELLPCERFAREWPEEEARRRG